jgi:hypothetical protein
MSTLEIIGIGAGAYVVLAFGLAVRAGQFMKRSEERALAAFEQARSERAQREAA